MSISFEIFQKTYIYTNNFYSSLSPLVLDTSIQGVLWCHNPNMSSLPTFRCTRSSFSSLFFPSLLPPFSPTLVEVFRPFSCADHSLLRITSSFPTATGLLLPCWTWKSLVRRCMYRRCWIFSWMTWLNPAPHHLLSAMNMASSQVCLWKTLWFSWFENRFCWFHCFLVLHCGSGKSWLTFGFVPYKTQAFSQGSSGFHLCSHSK